ncbi:MAG: glycosyltransferase family 25 protein [Pseudomonadota bacterium]
MAAVPARIFYINLDSRTDRRAFMESQLTAAQVGFERFPAVRPSIESLVKPEGEFYSFFKRASAVYKRLARDKRQEQRAIAYFGVYLSHYQIHQRMADEPGRDYIILEDDCVFDRVHYDRLMTMIEHGDIPDDWDIIRDCWDSTDTVAKFLTSNHNSRFSELTRYHNYYGGAHFSLFRAGANPKLLRLLDEDYVFIIDGVYSTHKLNVYHRRFGFHPADFGTDIPKLPEKTALARKLVEARRLAGRLIGKTGLASRALTAPHSGDDCARN